jgi:hypothetical protein
MAEMQKMQEQLFALSFNIFIHAKSPRKQINTNGKQTPGFLAETPGRKDTRRINSYLNKETLFFLCDSPRLSVPARDHWFF